jgi:hypothetical protein
LSSASDASFSSKLDNDDPTVCQNAMNAFLAALEQRRSQGVNSKFCLKTSLSSTLTIAVPC